MDNPNYEGSIPENDISVKVLPFPVAYEWYYWFYRMRQLGINMTTGQFFDWWSRNGQSKLL